jgi:hypothetical protein
MAGGKPSLGLLIGVGKPKPGPGGRDTMMDEDPMMGEEEESGEIVAARALMDAARGDDPQAVVDAFRGMLEWVDSDEAEEVKEEPPMPIAEA